MNIGVVSQYLNYVLIAISLAAGIASIVYKIKSNFSDLIVKFIAEAEAESNLTGVQKMDLVVGWIRNVIPRLFKVVFTDEVLRQIAQNIYNDIKSYRENYIKNLTDGKTEADVANIVSVINSNKSLAFRIEKEIQVKTQDIQS